MKASLIVVLVVLAAPWAAISQTTRRPGEPNILTQPGSPAVLAPGRVNGAPAAMLRNRSGRSIIAYRIGWLDQAGKPAFSQRIERRITRGERIWIRPHEFGRYPDARFFVAEIAFGDGTGWRADVNQLRRQLTKELAPKTVPV